MARILLRRQPSVMEITREVVRLFNSDTEMIDGKFQVNESTLHPYFFFFCGKLPFCMKTSIISLKGFTVTQQSLESHQSPVEYIYLKLLCVVMELKCKCGNVNALWCLAVGIPIKNTWWAVPQLLLNTRFCSALMQVSRPNHAHSSSDHVKKWSLFLVYPYGGGYCSVIIRTLLLASIILSSEWLEYSICKWSTVKKYNGMSITVSFIFKIGSR